MKGTIDASGVSVPHSAEGTLQAAAGSRRMASETLDLRREKEAAEAASAAKSRYLASVSHEIRSPLNAIYGYAQLLERGGEIDVTAAARIIRRSAEHLTGLIEGLADISQVENGVLRVSRESVRFGPFLDQIADMFRHSAESKGLRFVYERPDSLPDFVRMDQNRLRQILINLLSNAIKFTPAGSVGLHITYTGQVAVFEIRDTGIGIAPDDRDRIFAPFERGSATEATDQPGSGLGLAITQALVHILGGDLAVDSVANEGSVFRVTMMLGRAAGRVGEAIASTRIDGYEGERRCILVVDDDPRQLSMMRTLLEGLGFEVAVADSGAAALALQADRSFDLVLLDIAMPGLSGWETAERLRTNAAKRLRIVMVSANVQDQHRATADTPAHDRFLAKPVELATLIDVIGAELGLRWISGTDPQAAVGHGTHDGGNALPEAANRHIERLRDLLKTGHVRGVEREIKDLAESVPEADRLVARLFACLDRYDFAAMETVLEPHR